MYSNVFAEANSSFDEAEFVIYGVPFDGTSSFRAGSRWAPDTLRKVSYNFETYNQDLDVELCDVPLHDMGNCDTCADVENTLDEVYRTAKTIVDAGKVPIMMGGEHSLTYPCVKAFGRKMGFVVIDAHLDMRKEYRGVRHNHACVSRHVLEDLVDRYVTIGVRSGPKEEWDFVRGHPDIRAYSADTVRARGIEAVLGEVERYLADCDSIYLSLDMDGVDCSFAPGLGTPEPFGITPWDVRAVVRRLAPKSAAFDVVEISPDYDSGEVTSVLGAKLIRDFIAAKWKSLQKPS